MPLWRSLHLCINRMACSEIATHWLRAGLHSPLAAPTEA